jgi:hypothetical protein
MSPKWYLFFHFRCVGQLSNGLIHWTESESLIHPWSAMNCGNFFFSSGIFPDKCW